MDAFLLSRFKLAVVLGAGLIAIFCLAAIFDEDVVLEVKRELMGLETAGTSFSYIESGESDALWSNVFATLAVFGENLREEVDWRER